VGLALALLCAIAPGAAQAVTFSGPTHYPAGNNPVALALADFTGDARPDLAVANFTGGVSVLVGNADGSFGNPTSFPTHDNPWAIAVADFDRNARPDLVVPNHFSNDVSELLANGSGSFAGPFNFGPVNTPSSVAVGNFDAGSSPDVAVTSYVSNSVAVFLNNGFGAFTGGPTPFTAGATPRSVAVGSFNGDSFPDLVVVNNQGAAILLGNGSGGFSAPTTFAANAAPGQVAVGNFNGDANQDLAVTNEDSHDVSVLLGNGTGGFTGPINSPIGPLGPAGPSPKSVATADFNGDSHLDLVTGNTDEVGGNVTVLLGDGSGGFVAPSVLPGALPESVATADLNGDSRPDIIAGNRATADVSVFLNTSPTGFPRPKGAGPLRVPLVPASMECTAAGAASTHGKPLDYGSCGPPKQTSSFLTVGTPDANGAGAGSVGSVLLKVTPTDLRIDASMTDVRCFREGITTCGSLNDAAGPDYVGDLQVRPAVRMTDKLNSVGGGGSGEPATVQDLVFPATVPCAGTASASIGSSCTVSTSANAIMPGAAAGGRRAVWELGQIQVFDGGRDGNASTSDLETLFANQGLFVP
jgi:hypothetical protein